MQKQTSQRNSKRRAPTNLTKEEAKSRPKHRNKPIGIVEVLLESSHKTHYNTKSLADSKASNDYPRR
ncbi:hypothetical protein [Rufibacter sp. XAAS-G3-1]|uniref:hypothetical protein n=1 Tax=Rufibacter sp. XAAS-G3-1 TaxID=2729134 RepID=UPI0015E6A9C4|nr:hypothetical protein [Rufibacter sp. XAAS-G3-1]